LGELRKTRGKQNQKASNT